MTRFGNPIVFGNHDGFSMFFHVISHRMFILSIYIYIISFFFAHDGYYQYITHIPHVLFLISGLLFNLWDMMQLGNVEVTNSSLRLSWVRGPGNLWNPTLLRLVLQDILWNWGGFIGKMTSLVHDRRWPAAVATKQWLLPLVPPIGAHLCWVIKGVTTKKEENQCWKRYLHCSNPNG